MALSKWRMPRRRALAAVGAAALWPQAGATTPNAADRLPPMQRGFNLAHWFEYERTQGLVAEEFAALARMGLDHVRIPLDPMACGWRLEQPQHLPFEQALGQAVGLARAAGLTTVLDLHLRPDHKQTIENDPALEAKLALLWTALAKAFADVPPDRLVFELFNEPQYYGVHAWRWPALQRRLLAAVRAQAPKRAVLLSGSRGGGIEGLLRLEPERDPLVGYTFHFYEPFVFTHQGLPWLDDRYTAAGSRRDVLYPARLHAQRAPTSLRAHPKAAEEWSAYLSADWGPAAIAREIGRAGAWARRHGAAVFCNEFGAIRDRVDPASRYRWLGDVRRAVEAEGMGWTVWEYTHIFGLTQQSAQSEQAGRRRMDDAAYAALGLVASAAVR